MADFCHGTGGDHCCYLGDGGVCFHLEEYTVEGRRWVCGLYRDLGDWAAVHVDARYVADVQPWLQRYGIKDCGSWPPPGTTGGLCCYDAGSVPVTIGAAADGAQ